MLRDFVTGGPRACALVITALVALNPLGSSASAQTQIKPYFVVIFDDSGSMSASTGSGNNSCGQPRTRINDAKCALQQVVSAFGDVSFALTSFKEYGTGTTIHVGIAEDNQDDIVSWCDFTGTPELVDDGVTPIRDAVDDVRAYYQSATGPVRAHQGMSGVQDPARGCRPYRVILLHDGSPCCNSRNNQANSEAAITRLRNTPISGGPNEDIRTHVIFFGTAGSTANDNADDFAAVGGTGTAELASDEESLALAFANIIEDSILTETCDGADNDCDMAIDEGFQKYCDVDGVFGAPTSDPRAYCTNPGDDCDGMDDNCFRATDDEPVNACGTCGPPPAEVCDRVDNNCNGLIDEGDVCMGCVPTGAETCDNRDNDCDGMTDEGLTRACGTDIGDCTAGIETCTAGVFGGCTATGGGPEVCDGRDNDCDGRTDGMSEVCGTDVGTCRSGRRVCVDGSFGACVGRVGPGTEVCDGEDNDCDGMTDETDPDVGGMCGDPTGACEPGTIICSGGMLVCDGAVGPTEEICNAIDDDCDGVIDDGLGVGAACGSDVGVCQPGVNVCRDGETICEGEIGPMAESCNAIDDDCDGSIDEGLSLGTACGSDEGLCMAGVLQCVEGRETCVGEVPPGIEGCDCEDNDCDGSIDEEADGALCPGDAACVSCQCALPCTASEFGFTCPTGRTPEVDGDLCYCVREACNDTLCGEETIEREGEVRCGPGDDVPDCVCRMNACSFPCEGVVCTDGTVCEPFAGTCVEDNCRGLGCPDGQLCDPISLECEDDPCATTECAAGQACRDGECIGSCAGVECPGGQRCRAGTCEVDVCAGVDCGAQVCHPDTGECVDDMCEGVRCPAGNLCEPATGECQPDPCVGLTCPDMQVCEDGECVEDDPEDPDSGPGDVDAGPGTEDPAERVIAGGGGGCTCAVDDRAPEELPATLLGLFALMVFARRRRKKARGSGAARAAAGALGPLAAALTLVGNAGCDVEPFCLNCTDGGIDSGVVVDSGPRPDVPFPDTGPADTGPPDAPDAGCAPGRDELCNDFDDDCDGVVDEGVDTDTDVENCGGCGELCAPPGAFARCEAGVCGIERCDVGFFDIDGDPENGCEYACLPTGDDDSVCDFRDNDCDGRTDEDFDFDTDVNNCGSCGRTCSFAHASATCEGGTCMLGDCEAGFFDLDGLGTNGCEYACTPADPAVESCNRRDDDCDGTIDEGDPGGGAACGSDVGACMAGVEACVAGRIQCMGATEPSTETCNTMDDDCDGSTDEGFLSNDINNCGTCGNRCEFDNAFAQCSMGTCELVVCDDGFFDVNGSDADGCEYACEFNGAEACNGRDDDCDTVVDEDLTPPSNFCNPNGVCAAGTVRCDPAMERFVCDLPPTYEESEVSCDGLDNDCNGVVDDPFLGAGLGTSCSNGTGACQRFGEVACTADRMGVACNAPAAGTPGTEICDGLDNDCDGSTDEPRTAPGTNPSYVVEAMIEVRQGGSDFYIYQYEASRTDATGSDAGGATGRSCSRAGVLPWTQVSYPEARDACAAAGLRLCTEDEWERACESSSGSCTYAYASSCGTYQANTCNGNDYDPIPGAPDDDQVIATGALSSCNVNHTGADGGRVYDLSGNVKEWTEARSAGVNPLRGGSYNNSRLALQCGFDFTVADDDFQIANVGFRCCSDTAP